MNGKHFLGNSREMKPSPCPNCGYVSDMAAPVDNDDAVPKPGDGTICIKCGHLMVFADDLSLRNPTDEEIKKFAGDERIVSAMTALHHLHKDLGVKPEVDPNIIYPGKDPDFVFPEEEP